jgi:hypothetical protein
MVEYARYVDSRRALLARVAPPGLEGMASYLLHLLPGDSGYVSWGLRSMRSWPTSSGPLPEYMGTITRMEERLEEVRDSFHIFLEALSKFALFRPCQSQGMLYTWRFEGLPQSCSLDLVREENPFNPLSTDQNDSHPAALQEPPIMGSQD